MSVSIVATAGSGSANSFVTAAEATTYLGNRLNASSYWTDGTLDNEKRALIEATKELSLLDWEGTRYDTTQALSWPRYFAIDPDKPNLERLGDIALLYFATNVVPQRVKDATCELALEFLRAGTSDIASLDSTIGIKSESVGPISTTYTEPSQRAQGLSRFPRVMALITPLLRNGNKGGLDVVRT